MRNTNLARRIEDVCEAIRYLLKKDQEPAERKEIGFKRKKIFKVEIAVKTTTAHPTNWIILYTSLEVKESKQTKIQMA